MILKGTMLVLLTLAILGLSSLKCAADETNASVRVSPYLERRSVNEGEQRSQTETKSKPEAKPKSRKLSIPQLEQHMLEQINKDRLNANVAALKSSELLASVARDLADDLAKNNTFSHTTSLGLDTEARAKKRGITCPVFENLGEQSGPDPFVQMVDELQQAFMNEPPGQYNHRYILLEPKQAWVGVGIAKSKDRIVVVQCFTQSDPTLK
jgi:Uncharacterized protein with SCP/PR1 domains